MSDDLNSVKTGKRPYHHGALRPALLAAAESVIAERGVDGFSLRETARRAGVSPAAPAHHFGDARGLLTALATEAFRRFGDALEASDVGQDRHERIRSQGRAYVNFALAEPAKFDLMWRYALTDRENAEYRQASSRAFAILDRVVRGEEAAAKPVEDDISVASSIACWSLVHGFARLARDGVFGAGPGEAESAVEALLPAVLDRLKV
jgi:AcrR family transcriptional regulator